MIARSAHMAHVRGLLSRFPVVAILGARQVGKTTLARELAQSTSGPTAYFDLESTRDLARLAEPEFALAPLRGLVVLDEVQRRPDLFPALRVLADRPGQPARFLVLGSASPALLRQTSETLAGRVVFHELHGFDLLEVGPPRWRTLWSRGAFPPAFLAESDATSAEWRRAFVRTYLERELPELGIQVPPGTIRRFWTMLAHYHGQRWNGAELSRAFGVSEKTVRRYLEILCSTFLAWRLTPFHANLAKREVRAPKVYLGDTGLLHTLLEISGTEDLLGHPKVGASFEGFAIREIVRRLGARPEECHFWALHTGGELDLFVMRGTQRLGFEIKFTQAPAATRAMMAAQKALGLRRIDVVFPGSETFAIREGVRALSLERLEEDLEPLD